MNLNESRQDPVSLDTYLQLGPYADNDDRFDIARMYFSDVGRAESEAVLLRGVGSKSVSFPLEIRPPFTGRTRLQVRGMSYKIGSYPVLLVFAIVTCSGSFPWRSLRWNRDNPGSQGRKAPKSRLPLAYQGSYRRNTTIADGASVKITQSADPSAREVPLRVESGLDEARYRNLPPDTFQPRGPIKTKSASVYSSEAASNEVFGIGSGAHGSGVRAATLAAPGEREVPNKLTALRSALLMLESIDPANIVVLDHDVYELAKQWMPDDVTAEPAWAYLDSFARQEPRRSVLARVRVDNVPVVLIDTESRSQRPRSGSPMEEPHALGILRAPTKRAVSDDDVKRLLRVVVSSRGVIGGSEWRQTEFADWYHASLKHIPDQLADRYALRIVTRIRGPRMPRRKN